MHKRFVYINICIELALIKPHLELEFPKLNVAKEHYVLTFRYAPAHTIYVLIILANNEGSCSYIPGIYPDSR